MYATEDQFNQTMARLRALLADKGTMDHWRELRIILREERSEEQQALLLDYIDGHILGWAQALSAQLYEWWKEHPEQPAHVERYLQRIAEWQWSPGNPGEVRSVPGVADASVVWIPAGSYHMGSDDLDAPNHERPVTYATIRRSFWMWQTPVTQGQYREIMGHNPAYFSGAQAHPVERVTWHEAMAFCHGLSERLSIPTSIALDGHRLHTKASISGPYHVQKRYLGNEGFRLPTEAEWEWACRTDKPRAADNTQPLAERAWFSKNARGRTHPVKQKQPNSWGLYDMLGHVAEWCVDQWHPSLIGGEETDPVRLGPRRAQEDVLRVVRGSSWHHGEEQLYPGFRDHYRAEESLAIFGFRPVKTGATS